jgi:hypothetical protein
MADARAVAITEQVWESVIYNKGSVYEIIAAALAAERAMVWEMVEDKLSTAGDEYFGLMNTQARLAIESLERWCREQQAIRQAREGEAG